jgi:2-oxoglutarate ferredoxin oxidoreductase subunit gamma
MMMGKLLAEAVMREGLQVTYLPAYGAEVRGGTANCTVIVSDTAIGSPFVEQADSLIIMNEPSLIRFAPALSSKGLLVLNSSLSKAAAPRKGPTAFLPFTDMAIKLGNVRAANMAALGCFIGSSGIVSLKTVIGIIGSSTKASKQEIGRINKLALQAGFDGRV